MKSCLFLMGLVIMSVFMTPFLWASDINDIVYPPPEPEQSGDTGQQDGQEQKIMKPGISEESEKIKEIHVYPDGRVLVPGTTSFESTEPDRKKKHNNSDSMESRQYYNYRHHHKRPDIKWQPELSEKKGRTKSKLGITGPGHIIVPAKDSK